MISRFINSVESWNIKEKIEKNTTVRNISNVYGLMTSIHVHSSALIFRKAQKCLKP